MPGITDTPAEEHQVRSMEDHLHTLTRPHDTGEIKKLLSHAYHHLTNRTSSGSYCIKEVDTFLHPTAVLHCDKNTMYSPRTMSQGLRRPSGPITLNQPIKQVHTAMRAMTPAIKNATDVKSHLFTNSWALPGEEITLETLARTLFSVVANNPKITPTLANPILAVAYLITEKVEECAVLNITSSIIKHLLNTFIPISTDIQTRLENYIQAITESKKSHNALAEKLLNTQEKLDETSEKVSTNCEDLFLISSTTCSFSFLFPVSPPPDLNTSLNCSSCNPLSYAYPYHEGYVVLVYHQHTPKGLRTTSCNS